MLCRFLMLNTTRAAAGAVLQENSNRSENLFDYSCNYSYSQIYSCKLTHFVRTHLPFKQKIAVLGISSFLRRSKHLSSTIFRKRRKALCQQKTYRADLRGTMLLLVHLIPKSRKTATHQD